MNRHPAVAGLFYSDNAQQLRNDVHYYLSKSTTDQAIAPKAMIVPHAGYIYSAQAAAEGYQLLTPYADTIQRVVLLGPSHRVGFYGLALPTHSSFSTPLGDINVDKKTADQLVESGLAIYFDEAHQLEHSLEVQLPFLQCVLHEFEIVPIVVGGSDAETVSKAIDTVWGGSETLIIVSSDLSHYHPYQQAQAMDQKTALAIEQFDDQNIHHDQACGATPVRGLLISAKRHGLHIQRIALCNSGDTAGEKDRVVGYGTFAFSQRSS